MLDLGDLSPLLKSQEPERHELELHLASLKGRFEVPRAYIPIALTAERGQTHVVESVTLEHPTEGTLVLDVMKDGRLFGIEMISQIPRQ